MAILIRKSEELMMSLVHYFVVKENYAPILVQGVKDEVWLENMDGPYRIIRITSNSIINEEQYNFEIYKMKNIIHQIKKKTLSFRVNVLNICLDASEKVNFTKVNNINSIKINTLEEIKESKDINDAFPSIRNEIVGTDDCDSLDLILNVTNDINEKTERENKNFAELFSPKRLIFTKLIILICLAMYIIVGLYGKKFIEFDANVLALFGANNIMLVKSGEIWRLVTNAFLHAGLIHILVNMYSLSIVGSELESLIGKWKFLFVYLISALTGSLLSLVFMEENIVSVGASGAIFGLMGALLYFGYHYRLYLSDAIRRQLIPIIILNLVIGFMISGIDNFAHVGGLVGGYLALMAVGVKNKSEKKDMINGWIVLILLLAFLSYIVFFVK